MKRDLRYFNFSTAANTTSEDFINPYSSKNRLKVDVVPFFSRGNCLLRALRS